VLVVRAHLQQHHGAAPVGFGEQRVEQLRTDALALAGAGHADGGHVRLVVVGDEAGVPDDRAVVVGDEVVPGVGQRQLLAVHRDGPRVRREELLLELHDRAEVRQAHRAQGGHCVTALIAVGGTASGRRR
jgi:hypothetical protein